MLFSRRNTLHALAIGSFAHQSVTYKNVLKRLKMNAIQTKIIFKMKAPIESPVFVATLTVAELKEIMKKIYQDSTANVQPTDTSNVSEKGSTIKGIRRLAEYIGCGLNSAQKLKNEGIIPYSQYGNRLIFYSNEIDAALKQRGLKNDNHLEYNKI